MMRAGILTDGRGALILLAEVCIPQHLFPPSITPQCVNHDQPSFNRPSLLMGYATQAFDLIQPCERPTEGMNEL